ncbi:conserved hypothetical protein [Ricinus communis]|uniref:Uncharacterized protein n=1 Tax=Ricinus communis TaxID=3988 RepID=B9T6J0_RICCO|nr:conserved hypothetical protein [Ricinus communis]
MNRSIKRGLESHSRANIYNSRLNTFCRRDKVILLLQRHQIATLKKQSQWQSYLNSKGLVKVVTN